MKILITDGLAEQGLKILKAAKSLEITEKKGITKEELLGIIKDYDGLVVRSATKVTKEVIDASNGNLKVIGRAGIGVDNIDIEAATRNGIVVMNTPESNAITTAEHTITLLFSLARKVPQAHMSIKSGKWERNKYEGIELYGKTVGFIGLGNIGKLVAERVIGLKMKAIAYDPYLSEKAANKIGVTLVSLEQLLSEADVITVHTPLTPETKNLINKDTIDKMKDGVILINCARGGIINEQDIAEAIKSRKVAGAAFDVFTTEPVDQSNPLLAVDENIVLTPHLGASTEEAQIKVGTAMAEQIVEFAVDGVVRNAVNMPSLTMQQLKQLKPYLNLAEALGSLQGQLCKSAVNEIEITYEGKVSESKTDPLTIAVLKGFLAPIMDIVVTYVNAPVIAKERNIKVTESKSSESGAYTSLITVNLKTSDGEYKVSGTIFGKEEVRIVRVNEVPIDVIPHGFLLVSENADKPGFIGAMCTILGKNGINIGLMHLGRKVIGGRAIVFTNVDTVVPKEVIDEIYELKDTISLTQVSF